MAAFLPPEMLEIFYAEANQKVKIMQWITQRYEDKKLWLLFFNVLRM